MEEGASKVLSRILIVDDVEANRFVLRDIIADMGYQPVLTENGLQALKMLQRIRPQLIILDIAMPEMDGYEVCIKLKENPDTREIPIIFISAFDEPEDIVKGFNLGGADYVTKPFIPEVVKARVGMHLKLAEANRQMQEMNRQLQISVSEQRKQMERERRSVLYALLRVARENAGYDDASMKRLCDNSRVMAEAMQLSDGYDQLISDSFVDIIELAAPLCDLGNMALPTNILQKKGELTSEEREMIRSHASIGAKMLMDIMEAGTENGFVKMAVEMVHYHHENWDGSGYPEGRKGEEIPLSAQIICVVSDFCALTEDRSFRKAYDKAEALEIMRENAGIRYNPEIFNIMQKIVRQLH